MLLCRNVTLRSNYLIILFQQVFFIQGVILLERVQDLKLNNLIILGQPQTTQSKHTTTQSSTQDTLQYYSIHIDRYLEFIYHIEIKTITYFHRRIVIKQATSQCLCFPLRSLFLARSPSLFFLFFFSRFFFFYPNYHIINYKR